MKDYIEIERKHCFDYFYENFSRCEQTFGLMPDKIPDIKHKCSIAANGFMVAAMAVGVDYGYLPRDEAEEICSKTIDTLDNLPREEGFYYHFYTLEDGQKKEHTELSIIDSALLFAGVLAAGGYFGGETLKKARQLVDRCNWKYFYGPKHKQFYMGRFDHGFDGHWDYYAEQLLVYFFTAASEKSRDIALEAYQNFGRLRGEYGGHPFVYSWFGSLFVHQYSHAFLDFRSVVDEYGVNWFQNSVNATLANRQFCIDQAPIHKTYGKDSWGLTSCSTKDGYRGNIGAPPSGNGNTEHCSDGTVAPCGAIGSIVFTPRESTEALVHYYSFEKLVGRYGLYDAYNLDENWFAERYLSIDKGISLLMLANLQKQTIWKSFNSLEEIQQAYKILKFKEV